MEIIPIQANIADSPPENNLNNNNNNNEAVWIKEPHYEILLLYKINGNLFIFDFDLIMYSLE